MGTKVQSLPGYYSMRDLNEESSSCGWPLFYGDKALANGQYYHNYLSSAAVDVSSASDKDVVKQMMLGHEAIFKNQVFELHRLYRIQRDLMDEVKLKELQSQLSVGTSFSAGPLPSQITSEDGKKWHIPGFPIIGSSTCDRASISSVEGIHSPLGLSKGSKQACLFPSPNGSSSKDVEVLGSRPSKVRRKMFDLHLPADEYIDTEESEKFNHENISGSKKFHPEINCKNGNGVTEKLFCCNGRKASSQEHTSRSEKSSRSSNGLADLNEPVQVEESKDIAYVPPPHHNSYEVATECSNLSTKQKSRLFSLSREDLLNSHHGTNSWAQSNGYLESSGKVCLSSMETGQAKSSVSSLSHQTQSPQTNRSLVDSWHLPINLKLNPGFKCETSVKNGFYPGISSGSKELSGNFSSISYDYLNHKNDCKKITEQFNNGSINFYNSSNSNCNDIKSGKDIDLNVLFINDGEQKHEEQLAALPWLRAKTKCKNEAQNAGRSLTAGELSFFQVASSSNINETGEGSSGKIMHSISGLGSNDIEPRKIKASESCSKKKILGVPIFDMPQISPKGSSSCISPPVSVSHPSDIESVGIHRKNQVLDMNMPYDADVLDLDKQAGDETIFCKKGSSKETNSRNQIDLNLSMSEDETFLTAIRTTSVEMKAEIDLEAPAVPETEQDTFSEEKQLETTLVSPLGPQDTVEQTQDESLRHAAEAIVVLSSHCGDQVDNVISSPSERPMMDPLSWFVDVVSSCTDDLPSKFDNSRGKDGEDNGEMDYFESMTLKLTETKKEDYMPKPLVPEDFKVQEAGTTSLPTTRARKGPARRGRQRRDFQRDILPGLTSLSRHDVREDLQTFGGLMKATGHAWDSGLTRRGSSRNGYGRGRRRSQVAPSPPPPPPVAMTETCTPLKHKLNNIELGLEDRSLTGWGKTTRRPRRQRCPSGNPSSIWII
ncbi:uncharacterized protein LOC130711320 [Lotus japonicus]|uniref:uncharacterized protein LOC130711320 n=1 Tax=Lotus japonicus TaxID=34305 RepID=UPI002584B3B5|nr:uncharacterized protein LOC130711320 [Lotus japonicus]